MSLALYMDENVHKLRVWVGDCVRDLELIDNHPK